MTEIIITLEQLRGMIGLHVFHDGNLCQIVEVLEDSTSLVLQSIHTTDAIQPNQHGDANRRVPATYTIPVLNTEKSELHPVFLSLELS